MIEIIQGLDKQITRWVSFKLFGKDWFDLETSRAIGIGDGKDVIAGIVYSDYQEDPNGKPLNIEMSIATVDKRWCNRHTLRAICEYPFIQLNLERVQTHCSAQDQGVIMFNERLGLKREGYHRKAWPTGGDAISWSMLREECRWIK